MEHVLDWLPAYHDGELQGRKVRDVEEHLALCESCRAEWEALQTLSALLQESPSASDLLRPESFVAQVELRMPQRPVQTPQRPVQTTVRRTLETGWRLVPVGLFGAWAFVQTVFIVVVVILLLRSFPLTAHLFSSLLPPGSGVSWLSGWQCFADTETTAVWCIVDYGASLGGAIALGLAPLVVIGLLYWGWLAGWWVRQKGRAVYVQ